MIKGRACFLLILLANFSFAFSSPKKAGLKFFGADNSKIRYVGRIDFSNPQKPRIWAPGIYIKAKFKGPQCEIILNDENSGGHNLNYLEIVIDDNKPYRIQTTGKTNIIKVPDGLTNTAHTILICKDTESNIGYIDFIGFRCQQLLSLPPQPTRKIEYFGDSITSGTGMDLSVIACDKGQWYDQHNAYMSYGARTARNLNADWQLSALAGVGLLHSCCNMKVVLPQIYDKVLLAADSISWNFKNYQPDVVTICIGQNDGPKQDSTLFCETYIKFVKSLRMHYPKAEIICLTSPMGDSTLTSVLKRYLTGITGYLNANGDKKIHQYFFSKQYHNGCGGHPDLAEHQLIADELTAHIKQVKGW
ncbi:SGNH/GDSL hydrolase family protein [Mucilaginibacter xinganensis]|uniref:Acetyl xylan esterase n=1 Tax=Mucilaginibacter xinganensis TaxID=1234841 RepID=A0A223NRZ2_9SPHI|nr:SGNH/GDSL hydrolase family protein [Mucilaginibacter xinganensis]ASU32586.1 acetyl xylan esterase [Mucilaginibacter xinganensis]